MRFRPLCRSIGWFFSVVGLAINLNAENSRPESGFFRSAEPTVGNRPTTIDTWTLEQAVTRALEANTDLLTAKHELERQEGVRLQVRARMLPTIAASAGVNQREAGLVDALRDKNGNLPPPSKDNPVALFGYDMRIDARQTVFDGLSSWNATRRQGLLSRQAFLTFQGAREKTVSLVRQGFDAILMRNAAMEAERGRVDEYKRLVDLTERKQRAGEIPEFELLRVQAGLEEARADLAEATRAQGQAEQAFRRLLQISPTTGPLNLQGRFEPRNFALPLENAVGQAKANRPDLQAASVAVEAARRNQKAELGSYLPKIDAFASYGARTSYYTSSIRLKGWTYGLSGQWDIFDGGAARGRRAALRADERNAEERLADVEHGIVSRLYELYQGLQQAKVAMETQNNSVKLNDRAARDAQRQYEVGAASLEQVLQAEIAHRQSITRMNQAIYNYNSIVADIEFSIGGQVQDSFKAR
jgi:outer membrane protein